MYNLKSQYLTPLAPIKAASFCFLASANKQKIQRKAGNSS